MQHELKTWTEPFEAIVDGLKTHEIRKPDRNFNPGDTLLLKEWVPKFSAYTGREIRVRVTYVTHGGTWGLPAGVCVMSICPVVEALP